MKTSTPLKILPLVAAVALLVAACGGDDKGQTLALQFSGLEPLQNGFHYEGWGIVEGTPTTTGKFNINDGGQIVDLNGRIIENGEFDTDVDLREATAIVLTIEPTGDTDAVPSPTHILAGIVAGGQADLSVGHGAALGNDFSLAAGEYILATPTDGNGTNETSGMWFLSLNGGGPAVGLRLPALPEGWHYEGWVVINGQPVTTGRFLDVAAADFAAPFSGPMSGPPFPGEDFLRDAPPGLRFPMDIRGSTGVISVEPEPDDSPRPFTLKPLAGTIPGDAADHVTYGIDNNASSFPTGTALIR